MSKHGNLHQNLREGIFWMNFAARENKKITSQHTERVISLDREMSDITWIEVMLNALSLFIPRAILGLGQAPALIQRCPTVVSGNDCLAIA